MIGIFFYTNIVQISYKFNIYLFTLSWLINNLRFSTYSIFLYVTFFFISGYRLNKIIRLLSVWFVKRNFLRTMCMICMWSLLTNANLIRVEHIIDLNVIIQQRFWMSCIINVYMLKKLCKKKKKIVWRKKNEIKLSEQ